jgi:sterol desaturase/sphingolipid hydroxylase (fatty acid hydroxylase superfamily)
MIGALKRLGYALATVPLYVLFTLWIVVAALIGLVMWIAVDGGCGLRFFDNWTIAPFEAWADLGKSL